MTDLHSIAKAMGGEVSGNRATFPTPGHSARDRGSWATLMPDAPDGVLIHSKNGGDPLAIKDELRAKGVLPKRTQAGRKRDEAAWDYTDADGAVLYRKVRMALPDGGKSFRFEHPDGRGGWRAKRGDARPVPYRLPGLIAAASGHPIYMAEGEKQADKLASWGLVATSSKDWRREFGEYIAGRTVFILPDNDAEGARVAADAKAKLEAAGAKPVILVLPGLPPKGDVMDWSGTADGLRELAAAAAVRTSARPAAPAKQPAYLAGITAAALMAKQFDPVKYVVSGLLAEGVTLFGGPPKIGKSWLVLDIALSISTGRALFGSIPVDAGDVLYLALEDNERRLKSRLHKKGTAAPERLTLVTEWPDLDNGCLAELEAWADSVPKPMLVIVDVLKMVRGRARTNESLYDGDYRALTGLGAFARARGIAVIVVHHVRKMAAEDPLESISGTNGLTGAADCVMVLKRDIGTGHCLLFVRGRDIEESEKAVRFKPDNGTWELLGAADEVGRTNERHSILAALRAQPNPMTVREVSDILGKNYDAVRKCMVRMWSDGEITKEGRGLYACPHRPDVLITPQTGQPDTPDRGYELERRGRDGSILAPGETGEEPIPGFEQ